MRTPPRLLAVALLLAGLAVAARAEDPVLPLTAAKLPPGWSLTSSVQKPPEDAEAYAAKHGGAVEWLATQYVNVFTRRHQVHTVLAATEEDAVTIAAARAKAHGEDFVRRRGRHVFEVVGGDRDLAARVWALLEVEEKQATWRGTFRLACVDTYDDDERIGVAWRLGRLAYKRDDEALQQAIRDAVADWTFAPRIRLAPATWTFRPAATGAEDGAAGVTHAFGELPDVLGIAYVDAEATFDVQAAYAPVEGDADATDRAATARWPVDDPAVLEAVRNATAGAVSQRELVLALLVLLDARVEAERPPPASREPRAERALPPEVLARGSGSALERADLLVTLCRAAGLGAHLVAGWRPDLRGAHVWVRVHLGDEGWIPVDPAALWLGTSTRYVPLMVSTDGRLPLLHLARPRVRRVPTGG